MALRMYNQLGDNYYFLIDLKNKTPATTVPGHDVPYHSMSGHHVPYHGMSGHDVPGHGVPAGAPNSAKYREGCRGNQDCCHYPGQFLKRSSFYHIYSKRLKEIYFYAKRLEKTYI